MMAKKRRPNVRNENLLSSSMKMIINRLSTMINNLEQCQHFAKQYMKLCFKFIFCFIIASFIIAIISSSIIVNELMRNTFCKLFRVNSNDLCLIRSSIIPMANNLFIEPFNCSICEQINNVDIVDNISQSQFMERYAYSGVPVVIKNAIHDWKAMKVFSVQFFHQIYTVNGSKYQNQCQFFPYKTSFKTLYEALESNLSDFQSTSSHSTKAWYIGWSNCDPHITKILRKYYQKPYFLPETSFDSRLDWIFMGSPGYGASMHIDHVGHSSWQAQIKGKKLWTLQAPAECLFTCKTLQVNVSSGDIIVLDTDKWYHKTHIVGNELSITIGSEYD